jgi:hypothetical protein
MRDITVSQVVPEPETLTLLAVGLLALTAFRKRREPKAAN